MSDSDDKTPLPPDLRLLKFLVITLMAVMIVGLVAIVGLLVTRLGTPSSSPSPASTLPRLPQSVILPAGTTPVAVTFADTWLVVVTDAGTVLLYTPEGGAPVSTTTLP